MKKLTTAAFLVGGAILASQSAFGQAAANNLYFGFQNQAGGGTADYIINLGAASGIVSQTHVVDLSGMFSSSDFNSVLGSSSSMFGGVIGAASATVNNGTGDVYLTQLRNGGAGVSSVAGSSVSQMMLRSQDNTAYSDLGTLYSPAAGTGGLDAGKTWENLVDPNNATLTFQSNTGLNPDSAVSASSVLYEDLWYTQNSSFSGNAQPYTYLGYFKLDLTGATPSLTFTPQSVPEPTVLGLLGGAGLLFLSFRRRFNQKNA